MKPPTFHALFTTQIPSSLTDTQVLHTFAHVTDDQLSALQPPGSAHKLSFQIAQRVATLRKSR